MVLLFDLDDTLLDDRAAKNHYMPRLYSQFAAFIKHDEHQFYQAWRDAVLKYHNKYANGEMTFEQQRSERVKDAFGDWTLTDDFIADLVKAFDRYFREGWKPFSDTISTLEYLGNYRKGIISNGSSHQQNDKIDVLGIRQYFDCILISEEIGISKPDERIFRMACSRLDCSPADCFFVGDSWDIDIIGSSRAHMKPVWVNRYGKDVPEILESLHVIHELRELKEIIKRDRI